MSNLDLIPEDNNPLVIIIDFSKYVSGAKYSTLMRMFSAEYISQLDDVEDMEDYVARILLDKMKLEMKNRESNAASGLQQVKRKEIEDAMQLEIAAIDGLDLGKI